MTRRTSRGDMRRPRALRNRAGPGSAPDDLAEGGSGGSGVAADGFEGGLAERDPPHLGALAEHGDSGPAGIDVAEVEAAALADPEPGPVEQLEDREVAKLSRIAAGGGIGRVVDQIDRLLRPRHARQPLRALRALHLRRHRARNQAAAPQISEIRAY